MRNWKILDYNSLDNAVGVLDRLVPVGHIAHDLQHLVAGAVWVVVGEGSTTW